MSSRQPRFPVPEVPSKREGSPLPAARREQASTRRPCGRDDGVSASSPLPAEPVTMIPTRLLSVVKHLYATPHTLDRMHSRQVIGTGKRRARELLVPRLPVDFDRWYEGRVPAEPSLWLAPVARNTATFRGCLGEGTALVTRTLDRPPNRLDAAPFHAGAVTRRRDATAVGVGPPTPVSRGCSAFGRYVSGVWVPRVPGATRQRKTSRPSSGV